MNFLMSLLFALPVKAADQNIGHLNLLHLPTRTKFTFTKTYKIVPNFVFQKLRGEGECYLSFPKSSHYRRIKAGRTFEVIDVNRTFGATYKPDHLVMDHVVALRVAEQNRVSHLTVVCNDNTTLNEFVSNMRTVASLRFPDAEEFDPPGGKRDVHEDGIKVPAFIPTEQNDDVEVPVKRP